MYLVYDDYPWGINPLNICETLADAEECVLAWAQDYRECYYYATGRIMPYKHYKVKIVEVKEY